MIIIDNNNNKENIVDYDYDDEKDSFVWYWDLFGFLETTHTHT